MSAKLANPKAVTIHAISVFAYHALPSVWWKVPSFTVIALIEACRAVKAVMRLARGAYPIGVGPPPGRTVASSHWATHYEKRHCEYYQADQSEDSVFMIMIRAFLFFRLWFIGRRWNYSFLPAFLKVSELFHYYSELHHYLHQTNDADNHMRSLQACVTFEF